MAYVLGYFAADGSMIKNKRDAYYVEFTSTDKILLSQLLTVVRGTQKLARRPVRNEHKKQWRVQFGSRQWFMDLEALGFTSKKSLTLTFPKVPKAYIADFVRGYFDGDGCVYVNRIKFTDRRKKRLIVLSLFTSGSRQFLIDLLLILRQYGVSGGSLVKKLRGFELKFSHRDSIALHRFLYDTKPVLLYLPRKRVKFDKAVRLIKE